MDLDWVDVFPCISYCNMGDISAIAMLEGTPPPSPGMLRKTNPPGLWIRQFVGPVFGGILTGIPEKMNPKIEIQGESPNPQKTNVFSISWPMDVSNRQWCWPKNSGSRFELHFFPRLPLIHQRPGRFQRSNSMGAICSLEPKVIHVTVPLVETSRCKVAVKVLEISDPLVLEVLLFSLSLKSCSNLKLASEKRNQWCTRPPPCWSSMLNFPTVSILILH